MLKVERVTVKVMTKNSFLGWSKPIFILYNLKLSENHLVFSLIFSTGLRFFFFIFQAKKMDINMMVMLSMCERELFKKYSKIYATEEKR